MVLCSAVRNRIVIVPQAFPCPCCGNLTLGQRPPGTYWNCEVCGWEDHPGTFDDLDFVCGTNGVGLGQARENYKTFGASEEWLLPKVRRPRTEELP
jgi:ribosomal protein L37AE/L43A